MTTAVRSTPRCGPRSAGSAAALAGVRPDDLAATAITRRAGRRPRTWTRQRIGEVVWGNANGAGEDNRNVGRMAVLLAGLPVSRAGDDGQPALRLEPGRRDDRLADRSRPATPTSCSPAASSR